jgi:hypothetical protein
VRKKHTKEKDVEATANPVPADAKKARTEAYEKQLAWLQVGPPACGLG